MTKLNELVRRFSLYLASILIFTVIYTIVGNDPKEWNGIEPERDITLGEKFFNRLYFTTLSLSTIGYGEITPKSNKLRAITIVFAMIMIVEFYAFIFETKWHTKK